MIETAVNSRAEGWRMFTTKISRLGQGLRSVQKEDIVCEVVEEEVVVEGIRAPGSVGDPAVPVIVHLGLVIGLMLVVFGTAIIQRRRINVRV